MIASSAIARAEPLPALTAPQRSPAPTCPVGCGTIQQSSLSVGDNGWVFSFSAEGVTPSKMQWLEQDFYAAIKQQKIDEVLGAAWTTEKSKNQLDPAQEHFFHGVTLAVEKSETALYLSLATMSQTGLGRVVPGELSMTSAMASHRYHKDLGVLFMAFDKHPVRIPVSHQCVVVQTLTWVLDNIAALKVPGIHGLVIDDLQGANEHNVPTIIGLLDDIEIGGLALFVVQEMPAKLLRLSGLDDLIVKDSRLPFVVSGLMNKGKERATVPARKRNMSTRVA